MVQSLVFRGDRFFPPTKATVSFDRVVLKPGINHLESRQVEKLKSHPDYDRYLQMGAIEWTETPKEVKAAASSELPADLSNVNGDQCDYLIDSVKDVAVLERWLQAEQRKTVQVKLKAKIQELKGG